MTATYGLFEKPEAAQRAYTGLTRAGIKSRDITVVSGEPFEAFEFSHRDHSMILFRLALVGGVIGFLSAVALVLGTELAWPIVTGGMPIVAWWPNIIIMFELTMLGAILATVVSLLVMTELPTIRSKVYDPQISEGKILVAVENPRDAEVPALERTFKGTGITEVKTV